MFPGGEIIAFEGLDCSFKETNCNTFYDMLTKDFPLMKNKLIKESFPRYDNDFSSFFIKKWLDGSFDRERLKEFPLLVNSFFALDRQLYWSDNDGAMLKKKNEGYCFVFDRYNFSNTLYQRIKGTKYPSKEDFLSDSKNFGIPSPTIMVWMRIRHFNVLKQLLAKKKNKDKNELDIEFIYKTWESSEYILKNRMIQKYLPGMELVVCECLNWDGTIKSKEEIANFIYDRIQTIVSKKQLGVNKNGKQ